MADEPRHPTQNPPTPAPRPPTGPPGPARPPVFRWTDDNGEPYTDPHPDDAVAFMLRLATGGYDDAVAPAAKDLKSLLGR
ncbi:hypothetical protein [Kitasatospora sp. NPDC097643]|uniref:hypothetical protein n=1 Tax=Kitasatospora sp. NPDC097643 TaxID=3157230 RepID=UPI00332A66ED